MPLYLLMLLVPILVGGCERKPGAKLLAEAANANTTWRLYFLAGLALFLTGIVIAFTVHKTTGATITIIGLVASAVGDMAIKHPWAPAVLGFLAVVCLGALIMDYYKNNLRLKKTEAAVEIITQAVEESPGGADVKHHISDMGKSAAATVDQVVDPVKEKLASPKV